MCGNCEDLCATKAFDHIKGEADPMLCISCLHCLTICKDQVIIYPADMTDVFVKLKEHFNLTDEVLENKKSRYFV
jgi:ferredoxin